MRVLVTFASRHGATAGIAEAIAAVLRDTVDDDPSHVVEVLPADDVDAVEDYDAVIIGSAVYLGRWLLPARALVRHNTAALSDRPVWLFSSGPVGDPAVPAQDASDVPALADLVGARGSRTFSGRLRLAELSRAERTAIRGVHVAEGDYRDWVEIRSWAEDVADSLAPSPRP